MVEKVAVGIDFGTESVRVLLVDALTGDTLGVGVDTYSRFANGDFCDPSLDQYRQHPHDYTFSLQRAMASARRDAIDRTGDSSITDKVVGIGIDTTGSTPIAVSKDGYALALLEPFKSNPNAMFWLWKDHTGIEEAAAINAASSRTRDGLFTQFVGGTYSSEWLWAKALHLLNTADEELVKATFTLVEHCDWMPALLASESPNYQINPQDLVRGRCAAGHKGLWHVSFDGYPMDFLGAVDSRVKAFNNTFNAVYSSPSDKVAGRLSSRWANLLNLPKGTPIAAGAFDAHMGAVGNGIQEGDLSRIVGTSTCDMVVVPYHLMRENGSERLINAICGQVDGSIIPGMYGLEAGQSAVGDIFANFRDWIVDALKDNPEVPSRIKNYLLSNLSDRCSYNPRGVPLVIPNHNGRRTPNADQSLTGASLGLTLGTTAESYFAGLVQGTCYGGRHIMETFTSQGIPVERVIACGGIADKSRYVMQTMSDVFNVPIEVAASDQACALGAAMFGAVVGGVYSTVEEAQHVRTDIRAGMGAGFKATYTPQPGFRAAHDARYQLYLRLSDMLEQPLRELK